MRLRRRIGGIGVQLADLSSDVLCYKLYRADACVMLVAAVITAICGWRQGAGMLACALAAGFVAMLFLIFKLVIPVMLFVRVGDMLRFRYAFYAICLAGAISIRSANGFWQTFSAFDARSTCWLAGTAVVLANMMFMRYGGRMMLALAYAVTGGLCAYDGVFGLSVLFLAWTVRYSMVRKFRDEICELEVTGDISADYLVEIKVLQRNAVLVRRSRILCALMLLAGFCLALVLRLGEFDSSVSNSAAMKAIVASCFANFKSLFAIRLLVPFASTASLLFVAGSFVHAATDVLERLSGAMMLLFALVLAASLGWGLGIFDRLPPFSSIGDGGLIPSLMAAAALVLSASVFMVELGCREPDAIGHVDEIAELLGPMTRRKRSLRVAAFVFALLSVVVVVPMLF